MIVVSDTTPLISLPKIDRIGLLEKEEGDLYRDEECTMREQLHLNYKIIDKVKQEATEMVKTLMGDDLCEVILYGSCARGDYTDDSDIDIALLVNCNRMEAKKYDDALAGISANLAMDYFVVVNFASLPCDEFHEKRAWYGFFRNIDLEGEVLYG